MPPMPGATLSFEAKTMLDTLCVAMKLYGNAIAAGGDRTRAKEIAEKARDALAEYISLLERRTT